MLSKIKMSGWDFFVHLQSVFTVVILVFVTLLATHTIPISIFKDIPVTLSIFLFVMLLWLIGMLLEPFANCMHKITSFKWKIIKDNFEFKTWDARIKQLEENAVMYAEDEKSNIYQYAKNMLIANNKADDFNVFLGRFGFYRNHSCIFIVYGVVALFAFPYKYALPVAVISFLSSAIYLYRSEVFFRHMSVTVYSQFIIHMSSQKKELT